jgi:hypothetical protein
MKKIVILLILIWITYYAWENMKPNQEVIDAKKELWLQINEEENKVTEAKKEIFKAVDKAVTDVKENIEEVIEEKITPTFSTEYLTDSKFLELNPLDKSDLIDWEVELIGKTLQTVDKIRVLYSNKESSFPDDDFTLKKFKSWDSEFLYRAFSRYETFDFGTNIYTFFAYSWEDVSKMELIIYYPNPDELKKVSTENNETSSEWSENKKIDASVFPTWSDYGSPIKMWEEVITYTDITGFEITRHEAKDVTCNSDIVTKTLQDKTTSWSWWNTCRPSKDNEIVSFFGLSMKDWNYIYSKHYYSSNYYAIIELESGLDDSWISLESVEDKNAWLKSKNNELKIKNEDFEIIEITDNLFTEITQ